MFFKSAPNYLEKVSYKLDEENNIIYYGDDWDKSAEKGNAPQLIIKNNVLGTNILSHISGNKTKAYYYSLFESCRLYNKKKIIEYRCDSTTHKRSMEMQIIPQRNGEILVKNYLFNEIPFSEKVEIFNQPDVNLETPILRCSICNRLRFIGESDWVFPEQLKEMPAEPIYVVHSICLSCREG